VGATASLHLKTRLDERRKASSDIGINKAASQASAPTSGIWTTGTSASAVVAIAALRCRRVCTRCGRHVRSLHGPCQRACKVNRRRCKAASDDRAARTVIVRFGTFLGLSSLSASLGARQPPSRHVLRIQSPGGGERRADAWGASPRPLRSPKGRYRHSPGYLKHVLADTGLQSEIVRAELRLEAGEPVPGLAVRDGSQRLDATAPSRLPLGT
jgi:hypothetical protein